jgi:hypothetical protein
MNYSDQRIANLENEIIELREVIRNLFRTATVSKYDGEKDQVTAFDDVEGDDDNGKPETPPIRVIGQSGKVKRRTTISEGEQILIISPGGNFGETSLALPLGYNKDNPSPSNADVEDITTIGSTTMRLNEGSAALTGGKIDLGASGGPAVARLGDQVLVSDGSSAGLWPIVTAASKTYAT